MYLNARNLELLTSAAYSYYVAKVVGISVRTGTDRNDFFDAVTGDIISGGKGDDWYNLWAPLVTIKEDANGGIDTAYVQFWGKATLADNVENMVLVSRGATAGTGNALGNIIQAGTTGATLNGKQGDDVLVGGAGADVFVVEAGTGSDAIMNFTSGIDAILLQDYGITSFDQVIAAAAQTGSDVTLSLGSDTLVLRDVSLSGLTAADFGMLRADQQPTTSADSLLYHWMPSLNAFDPTPITLAGAGRGWNANGWYVLNNMWGCGGLTEGVDFTVNSTFSRGDMTKGVTFNWSVPYTTDYASGIKGYPEVAFGVPPKGNHAANPTDKATVFPIQVSDLVELVADYDVAWSGTTSAFNVAYDIWLTNKPNGDASTITNEIMVWVHKPTAFGAYGKVVGTYSHDGMTGTIYHEGTYTAVVFDHDVPAGKLDITALLAKLQSIGIVSADEYLAAIELGAEMTSGVGSLTINNLDLTVVSKSGHGTLVTKEVTGAGTTVTEVPMLPSEYHDRRELWIDIAGLVAGTKVTATQADGSAIIRFYGIAGGLIQTDVVRLDADGQIVTQHYAANGKLTGSDVEKTVGAATTVAHFDAEWRFAGSETTTLAADGTLTIRYFDALRRLLGTDVVGAASDLAHPLQPHAVSLIAQHAGRPASSGAQATQHYDADGKLVSINIVTVEDGKSIDRHYNDAGRLLGTQVTITDAQGNVTIEYYNRHDVLRSSDLLSTSADGTVTTTHINKFGLVTGTDVVVLGQDGVTTATHANAHGRLTSSVLTGTAADDVLTGGALRSDLHGGLGSDTLVRGAKATGFWFDTAIDNGDVDRIVGFVVNKDTLFLDHDIFTGVPIGEVAASAFERGNSATRLETRFLFDAEAGNLFFDVDGKGGEDAVLFAHIDSNRALTAADLMVF